MASYAALAADDGPLSRSGTPIRSAPLHRRRPARRKDTGVVGQASWISSVVNLVNTIVGAGVLAMPLSLSRMGVFLGVCTIIWSGMTAGFGLYLQTRCARYLDRGHASFFALSQLTYPNAAVVFDAAIAIKCFGVGVSYLIIIGNLMPGVVKAFHENAASHAAYLVDRHFWITVFMLAVIPFSFLRRLDSLKYTSVVALVSISYLVVLVVYHFAEGDTIPDRGNIRGFDWAGFVPALASFPVIVFAYTCHQNMFSVLNEIADNSPFRTTSVVTSSIGSSCAIYILVAITGYLSFGDNVGDNIVNMYHPSIASTIGRIAIVILVMFSYPLQVHPCRGSVDAVLKWRPFGNNRNDNSPARQALMAPTSSGNDTGHGRNASEPMSETRFALITTAIIVCSYIVAMSVSSLERVLAYVGSTGSTSISFILPGLFYYKISDPESVHHQRLIKEDDDEDEYDSNHDEDRDADAATLAADGTASSSRMSLPKPGRRRGRRDIVRKLSLGLAIYGAVVMAVCLTLNVFFTTAH